MTLTIEDLLEVILAEALGMHTNIHVRTEDQFLDIKGIYTYHDDLIIEVRKD